MKLFLTVALSLTLIALVAHAQDAGPTYPPPPAPPPGYYPPPPPPPGMAPPDVAPPEAMPPEALSPSPPASAEMIPPPPPTPQQAVNPVVPPPVPAQAQSMAPPALQAQQQGNITFVSGGAGDDDRAALKQVESQYNLRLMFAARNGDFLANIGVTLADAHGGTVLDTIADGPIFYAHVPTGRYRLTVSNQGQAQSRDVNIGPNGSMSQDFYWASGS